MLGKDDLKVLYGALDGLAVVNDGPLTITPVGDAFIEAPLEWSVADDDNAVVVWDSYAFGERFELRLLFQGRAFLGVAPSDEVGCAIGTCDEDRPALKVRKRSANGVKVAFFIGSSVWLGEDDEWWFWVGHADTSVSVSAL